MKRMIAVVLLGALCALCGEAVLAQEAPEPNAGTHIQFTGSYAFDGGQVAVAGVNVPVSNRWSINLVNAFAPTAGMDGVSFHVVELEYARKLSDLVRAQSSQFNSDRFYFAVTGGAGTARNAQGSGNGSFAFSAAGRFTLRINESSSLDLVNVRYFRSRIATVTGQRGGDVQAGAGFRFSF